MKHPFLTLNQLRTPAYTTDVLGCIKTYIVFGVVTMSLLQSYLLDLSYYITTCFSCFPSSPSLKINNRSFKIQRLLGEVSPIWPRSWCHDCFPRLTGRLQGGFSYVYLVQENSTASLYALKKIRCPFGQESVSQALKEVEAYSLFSPHPNIIHSIDHSIASDKHDPGAKTVYILLPYYRRGNLQDIINANLVNHTKFPERRLMVLLLGVCRALKSLHQYKVKQTGGDKAVRQAKRVRREAQEADQDAEEEVGADGESEMQANSSRRRRKEAMRMEAGGDVENEPLMEDELTASQNGIAPGQLRAYAHRDIKPGEEHSIDS